MATQTYTRARGAHVVAGPLIGGKGFDIAIITATLWLLLGSYSDAWAHIHLDRLETFFTPWHALLYSGVLVVAIVMIGSVLINRWRGADWLQSIPLGYGGTLLGVLCFFLVGVGDMTWHLLFGIERNIEAQFSPTHVAGMVCLGLITFGPYRAAYQRLHQLITPRERFFLLVAQSLILLYVMLITLSANPLTELWPLTTTKGNTSGQLLAIVCIFLQAIFLTGLLLYTVRRWRLFVGFFTVTYTVALAPLVVMSDHSQALFIGLVAGLLTDAAYRWLRPTVQRPEQFHIFAGLMAAIFYTAYFLVIQFTVGVVWSIHLSAGAVVVSGIFSWMLSYLLLPSLGEGN